jgi:dTDP-4-dehydrorhamnose reductase
MTWLIVGANGQLGNAFSAILKARDIEYNALSSDVLDIRSATDVHRRISILRPKIIVNCAAWTNVDTAENFPVEAHTVNVLGALNLVEAAKAIGALFIQISTDYVFSGIGSEPWKENDPPKPISIYGITKASGENVVLTSYPEHTYVFRTAWLYSQWGRNFVKNMVRLALGETEKINVADDLIGQPTSAIDLVNQIIDTVNARLPLGIYHATNSGAASRFELATEIFNLCNVRNAADRIIPISSVQLNLVAKRPAYSVLGHEAWIFKGVDGSTVPEMRNWKVALKADIPDIIRTCMKEMS